METNFNQILNSYEVAYKYNSSLTAELNEQKKKTFSNLNLYKEDLKSIANPEIRETDIYKLENFPNLVPLYNQSIVELYVLTSKSQINLLEKEFLVYNWNKSFHLY